MTRRRGSAAIEKKNRVLETLRIEYAPAARIKPNAYNPNRQSDHDFLLLVKSMLEDGFTQPILAMRTADQDGLHAICDGEHRWTAAIVVEHLKRTTGAQAATVLDAEDAEEQLAALRHQRLDLLKAMPEAEIPVVFTDMTPEQMRIATLRHNRARGSEDYQLTAQLLRDLRELGALDWAQDSLLLDDVELQRLLDDVPAPEALAGEEFNAAWEPGEVGEDSERGAASTSMTPEAIERIRAQERRIEAARNEEERVAARKDSEIFRLSLVFSGEEATIVKAALGKQPAVRLLALCREITPAPEPETPAPGNGADTASP